MSRHRNGTCSEFAKIGRKFVIATGPSAHDKIWYMLCKRRSVTVYAIKETGTIYTSNAATAHASATTAVPAFVISEASLLLAGSVPEELDPLEPDPDPPEPELPEFEPPEPDPPDPEPPLPPELLPPVCVVGVGGTLITIVLLPETVVDRE